MFPVNHGLLIRNIITSMNSKDYHLLSLESQYQPFSDLKRSNCKYKGHIENSHLAPATVYHLQCLHWLTQNKM